MFEQERPPVAVGSNNHSHIDFGSCREELQLMNARFADSVKELELFSKERGGVHSLICDTVAGTLQPARRKFRRGGVSIGIPANCFSSESVSAYSYGALSRFAFSGTLASSD